MTGGIPDPSAAMRKAISGLDALSLIAEATAGYRKKLVEGGIGPEAADRMAETYHVLLLDVMSAKLRSTS